MLNIWYRFKCRLQSIEIVTDSWLPGRREGLRIGGLQMQTIMHRMDNNKLLLFGTGGYIQRLVTNYNGEEY